MACGIAWRSCIVITGILAAVTVGAGALVCWLFLPPVLLEITRIGDGFDWIRGLSNGSQANMYGSVGVSVLALVPVLFSVEGCRESLFGQKSDEGCCSCIQRGFQTVLGVWLVTFVEVLLFFGIIWQLAITFIYSFVMGLMFISSNVCGDPDGQAVFSDLVQAVGASEVNTPLTSFLGAMNVTAYCGDYQSDAFGASRNVFGAGVAVLLALIISFMSVGRAKEAISRELKTSRLNEMEERLTGSRASLGARSVEL